MFRLGITIRCMTYAQIQIIERIAYNNRLQLDNLQAVRFAVSLSLHFTAKRPAYKSRLKRALVQKSNIHVSNQEY